MALNTTDVRQRAYKPIDVCSAGGSWIDEPSYNKANASKTVRMGNWLDEERLNKSMAAVEYSKTPTSPRAEEGGKRGKHVSQAPNVQSSVFLTAQDTAGPKGSAIGQYETTYGSAFQGSQPRGAPAGVRRHQLEQQVLEEADQTLRERTVAEQSGTAHWITHNNDVNRHAPQIRAKPYDPAEEHTSYLSEQAVSLYGSQRVTGMSAQTGDNPHKKNTNFTTPIGLFNKSTTPAY